MVSGLFKDINDCLKRINIKPHTVQLSLGVFGRKDRLPDEKILEVTTMCGHHLISPMLVEKLVLSVKNKRMTPEDAAEILGRQCICGAFNKARAVKLFKSNLLDSNDKLGTQIGGLKK